VNPPLQLRARVQPEKGKCAGKREGIPHGAFLGCGRCIFFFLWLVNAGAKKARAARDLEARRHKKGAVVWGRYLIGRLRSNPPVTTRPRKMANRATHGSVDAKQTNLEGGPASLNPTDPSLSDGKK
jgi:hypothetical protein